MYLAAEWSGWMHDDSLTQVSKVTFANLSMSFWVWLLMSPRRWLVGKKGINQRFSWLYIGMLTGEHGLFSSILFNWLSGAYLNWLPGAYDFSLPTKSLLLPMRIAMQEQENASRRGFGKQVLGSLLTYSMLETVMASGAIAETVKPIAAKWLADVNQMSVDLKGRKLKQTDWQSQVEQLFSQVDLAEFLSFVNFEQLIKTVKFRERGEKSFRATFPKVEGLPTDLVFGHQMFALRKGRSVVPHGHNNMATSFLILQGDFEGKHYDRLDETDDHMIIKPTINRQFGQGEYSTISDHKDNVHWFKAMSDTGFIFNIHVLNVDPQIKRSGRVYVDPAGEKISGGRIKAEKMKSAEAFRRYG